MVNDDYKDITALILKCCFEVINDLGTGFLENVYKNALVVALADNHLFVEYEKPIDVFFRNQKVGLYKPDLIVENSVIIELKCCKNLLPEHQAQSINYLKATGLPIALLVNFGAQSLEYRRLHHPANHTSNRKRTEKDLVDFFQHSPLKGLELDFTR